MTRQSLWDEEKPLVQKQGIQENFILFIHFDGSREVVSTLDPSVDWKDDTVWSAGFVSREDYQEYQRSKTTQTFVLPSP